MTNRASHKQPSIIIKIRSNETKNEKKKYTTAAAPLTHPFYSMVWINGITLSSCSTFLLVFSNTSSYTYKTQSLPESFSRKGHGRNIICIPFDCVKPSIED